MHDLIGRIVDRYDAGQVSRRDLIHTLAALAATVTTAAAAEPPFRGTGLNHIAVRVTDIPRTKAFYQELLGLPLISESASSLFLKTGDEFLSFFKNETPGLDHYCVEVEGFKVDEVTQKLNARGLKTRRPSGTSRVYFRDPDGLEVQFSAPGHSADAR